MHQETGHQQKALAGALYAYASNLDNLAALGPIVELITQKHASLYVLPEHYKLVGEYLLAAMGEVLGDALTPEILSAWQTGYWELANLFISREKELYAEGKDWSNWRKFRIARKVVETPHITSFYLEPVDAPRCPATGKMAPLPLFRPGQYIGVRVPVPAMGGVFQIRQYSLSNAPGESYYRISVKREEGEKGLAPAGVVSNILHDTKEEGDEVELSHPYGDFFLDNREDEGIDAPVVLLGAGVGLTCLTSIALDLSNRGSTRPIVFAHGSHAPELRPFAADLKKLAAEKPNFSTVFFDKEQAADGHRDGRLAVEKLHAEKELFAADKRTQYFVCGPVSFMQESNKKLLEIGIPAERIHLELFGTGGTD